MKSGQNGPSVGTVERKEEEDVYLKNVIFQFFMKRDRAGELIVKGEEEKRSK